MQACDKSLIHTHPARKVSIQNPVIRHLGIVAAIGRIHELQGTWIGFDDLICCEHPELTMALDL